MHPYLANDGLQVAKSSGLPLVGELSRLLFDMIVMDRFDKEFEKEFPKRPFLRFQHEVYIPLYKDDDVHFNEKRVASFLEKRGLRGEISSIQRGLGYLKCGVGLHVDRVYDILIIMGSGKVRLFDVSVYTF